MLRRHRKWWWKYPPQSPNTLTLKKLDAASQAGRVTLPGQTRGQKADRLQLVAKIAPIDESDAALHNWSATGIAVADGNAYISWHSNHQAQTPADRWGGALDVISIAALENLSGAVNPAGVLVNTLTSSNAKFNNVVADATNLYLPMTCYNNGAVVGRVAQSALSGTDIAVDTIAMPGSSVNSVAIKNSNIIAVTGYAGGVYTFPTDFVPRRSGAENFTRAENVVAYAADFGGKYTDGDYVLRTDADHAYIIDLANPASERNIGAPLLSQEKYAEAYDPANDEWYDLTGEQARYYGKHTMAKVGNHYYVAGGLGENGVNGLRVYNATSQAPVWQNGTNTTAVCSDGEYIYAATGAGLRVYQTYDSQKNNLPLYAYEVQEYDGTGKAVGHQAGTDAHSSNFVAVGGGYIFVACGQSGVYIFKLDTTVEVTTKLTGVITPDSNDTEQLEDGEKKTFTIPAGPEKDGEDFAYWVDKAGNHVNPGETELEAGTVLELTPVYKQHEYKYTLVFAANRNDVEVSNLPETIKSDDAVVSIPTVKPTVPAGSLNSEFIGWATNPGTEYSWIEAGLWTPLTQVTFTEPGTVTVYAVWAQDANTSGNAGGGDNNQGNNGGDPGTGGGTSNSGSGTL